MDALIELVLVVIGLYFAFIIGMVALQMVLVIIAIPISLAVALYNFTLKIYEETRALEKEVMLETKAVARQLVSFVRSRLGL